jgi:hypothetical protein
MQIRELIGTAQVPGGTELTLYRRGGDYMIVMGHNELMSSRMSGSEEALANMTRERLGARKTPHWLIGGYGMGFTLRAALAGLDATARITLAELVPEIIQWARGPMAELQAGCLDDPRVNLVNCDVADAIASAQTPMTRSCWTWTMGPTGWCGPAMIGSIRKRAARGDPCVAPRRRAGDLVGGARRCLQAAPDAVGPAGG